MESTACKVCGNTESNLLYKVREMFLGFREIFDYQKCNNCGCMQLLNIPQNLSKYYPADKYYSFKSDVKDKAKVDPLRKIKAEYLIYNRNRLAGKLLSIGYKVPEYFDWLRKAKVDFDDAILDVGCGNGGLLVSLNKIGFTNLTGIDPYNEQDYDYGSFKVYKKDIFDIDQKYDFIMLNHVLEHMDEPQKVLNRLFDLLNNDSYLLIRTPVMGTYAWDTYKENWMNLDAPRHLIIHTVKSIQVLAERAGFMINGISYDQIEISLIGSEQYKRDISLLDAKSYIVNKKTDVFSPEEIQEFKKIAKSKNAEGNGDQAAFYLYKP